MRVQRTLGMLAEVVGLAAGICREKNCLPRAVYSNHLELLKARMRKGVPPQTVQGERLPFANCTFACYLPWEDKAVSLPAPALPAFTRSIVVRFPTDPAYARIIEPH